MKLTITRISRKNTDKDGNPLISSTGKPYERLGVQAREYGEKWLSGFTADWNKSWKEGDTVEVELEEKGQYINIKKPDPQAAIVKMLNEFAIRMGKYESRLDALEKKQPIVKPIAMDTADILDQQPQDEDLPF